MSIVDIARPEAANQDHPPAPRRVEDFSFVEIQSTLIGHGLIAVPIKQAREHLFQAVLEAQADRMWKNGFF